MQTNHESSTPLEKTQCPVHLTSEKVQGNLPQCPHTKESRAKKHFPTEKAFISSGHQQVQGKGETCFRFSDPKEAARSVLEEQRDHLLTEAKSETLEQECKVDTLNSCIREFQRQAHSNRLEMDNVNYGYEEHRREQARLHEELAQREKPLRDTRIRNIHEVEEWKRAQEMRIDEFSTHSQPKGKSKGKGKGQEKTSRKREAQPGPGWISE